MLKNLYELDTPHGLKSIELHHADITQLDSPVDLIVVSAFKNEYVPVGETVIMGHSMPAYKHLAGLNPATLIEGVKPQQFVAEWDSVRIQRNTAAHPGIIHPEQVNVIVGSLHRLNQQGTFRSLYDLKTRLRR